jgi:hypothetical protein
MRRRRCFSMKSRLSVLLAVGLGLAILSGCSKHKSPDPAFARKVIDAVYAGSLSPLRDSMTPEMQATPDAMMAKTRAILRTPYGAVKDVKLKSTGVVQGFDQQIWTITAERGSYDMRLVFAKDGKLAGLWF